MHIHRGTGYTIGLGSVWSSVFLGLVVNNLCYFFLVGGSLLVSLIVLLSISTSFEETALDGTRLLRFRFCLFLFVFTGISFANA